MKKNFPLIIRVNIEQTVFDPGAIDTEIYCVNNTDDKFSVVTKSESFTTIDEITGDSVEHGLHPSYFILLPGEAKKIWTVQGWEWDGHVGLKLIFQKNGNESKVVQQYNLKESKSDYFIEELNIIGRLVVPLL